MNCVNINDPEFQKLADKLGNPLLAEIEYKKNESKDLVKDLLTIYDIQYQLPQGRELDEFIASEKTIRDLAARMADRIGMPYKIISDRTKQYKGKIENNVAYINLAYATLDTTIHEILSHPIIRTLKNKELVSNRKELTQEDFLKKIKNAEMWSDFEWRVENKAYKILDEGTLNEMFIEDTIVSKDLYQNLLKELEYGKGKEVLDRIKRDYPIINEATLRENMLSYLDRRALHKVKSIVSYSITNHDTYAVNVIKEDGSTFQYVIGVSDVGSLFTEEEQQEEAIVELMSLMVAEKLNPITDKNLISLLKQLLKQINAFIKSLLNTKELNINDIEADNIKFLIDNKLKELIKNGIIKKEC